MALLAITQGSKNGLTIRVIVKEMRQSDKFSLLEALLAGVTRLVIGSGRYRERPRQDFKNP